MNSHGIAKIPYFLYYSVSVFLNIIIDKKIFIQFIDSTNNFLFSVLVRSYSLKSATKPFNVLLACTRPLIT